MVFHEDIHSHGDSSLRRLALSHHLDACEVDCFALYVSDYWAEERYVAHGVDHAFFFPESLCVAPPASDLQAIGKQLKGRYQSRLPVELTFGAFTNATTLWPESTRFPSDWRNRYPNVLEPFLEREAIQSAFVFRGTWSTVPLRDAFLFLYFRSRKTFDEGSQRRLIHLAEEVFGGVSYYTKPLAEHTQRFWRGPLLRTVRLMNRLDSTAQSEDILSPGAFERFAGDLKAFIAPQSPDGGAMCDRDMLVTVHAFESTPGGVRLDVIRSAALPAEVYPRHYLCDGTEMSVVLLAALTGATLWLPYVDGPGTLSVPISQDAANTLREPMGEQDVLTVCESTPLGPPRLQVPHRLAADPHTELLSRLAPHATAEVRRALTKLSRRARGSATQWFRPLVAGWTRPSSELAIPLVDRGRVYGVLNFEVAAPYRIHAMTATVLSFAAQRIAFELVRARRRALDLRSHEVTRAVISRHRPDYASVAHEVANVFAADGVRILARADLEDDPRYQEVAAWGPSADNERVGAWAEGLTRELGSLKSNAPDIVTQLCDEGERGDCVRTVWRVNKRLRRTKVSSVLTYGGRRPWLLVGVRLASLSSVPELPSVPEGVLWARYTTPGRLVGLWRQRRDWLRKLSEDIFSIGGVMSVVPQAVRERDRREHIVFRTFAHEGLLEGVRSLAYRLRGMSAGANPGLSADLISCYEFAEYVAAKAEVSTRFLAFGSGDKLRSEMELSSKSICLRDYSERAWRITRWLYADPSDRVRLVNDIDACLQCFASPAFVLVGLVNVMLNACEHGCDSPTSCDIHVDGQQLNGFVKLSVADPGGAMNPGKLRLAERSVLGAGATDGLGIAMLRDIALAMTGVDVEYWSSPDGSGSRVSWFIPAYAG